MLPLVIDKVSYRVDGKPILTNISVEIGAGPRTFRCR